jgi:hypothetical protein
VHQVGDQTKVKLRYAVNQPSAVETVFCFSHGTMGMFAVPLSFEDSGLEDGDMMSVGEWFDMF